MKSYKIYKNVQKSPKILGLDASNAVVILLILILVLLGMVLIDRFVHQLIFTFFTVLICFGLAFLNARYNFSYLRKRKDRLTEINYLDGEFKQKLKGK